MLSEETDGRKRKGISGMLMATFKRQLAKRVMPSTVQWKYLLPRRPTSKEIVMYPPDKPLKAIDMVPTTSFKL